MLWYAKFISILFILEILVGVVGTSDFVAGYIMNFILFGVYIVNFVVHYVINFVLAFAWNDGTV